MATTSRTSTLNRFLDLPQRGCVQAEYVWIDADNGVRSKVKTLKSKPASPADLPEWNFDGSSTGQAPSQDSDVYLRPVAMYPCPFRRGDNLIVLAECWNSDGTPNKHNHRHECAKLMNIHKEERPMFGLEQEYTLFDEFDHPVGWPKGGFPGPQGPYYCGVGTGKVYCRDIVEAHYRACMYAGVNISGINAEVMPSQWEFQVGPSEGIDGGDELWLARFLLERVAEDWGVKISFQPKPLAGDWNGAGCHSNFSTQAMREKGGMKHIESAIQKLSMRHKEHLAVYGSGNEARLTGRHETASMHTFTSGVANRGASVRIPRSCAKEGCGYLEDRRPASNIDPYLVTGILVETVCGGAKGTKIGKELEKDY